MSTSVISRGAIVEVEGHDATWPGHDRRRAIALAFAMSLAVGSAAVGRDGPETTAPVDPPHMLILSKDATDAVLFGFPDRLANEPLPNLQYVQVVVRGTEGLAVNVAGGIVRPDIKWIADGSTGEDGGKWTVLWTEDGTAYSLSSDRRSLPDLLRVAGSLR